MQRGASRGGLASYLRVLVTFQKPLPRVIPPRSEHVAPGGCLASTQFIHLSLLYPSLRNRFPVSHDLQTMLVHFCARPRVRRTGETRYRRSGAKRIEHFIPSHYARSSDSSRFLPSARDFAGQLGAEEFSTTTVPPTVTFSPTYVGKCILRKTVKKVRNCSSQSRKIVLRDPPR